MGKEAQARAATAYLTMSTNELRMTIELTGVDWDGDTTCDEPRKSTRQGRMAVELRADTSDRKTSGARDESIEMWTIKCATGVRPAYATGVRPA